MSIHELRGIAESYGIADVFSKDEKHLRQEIELAKAEHAKPQVQPIPKPEYDPRIRNLPPAKECSQEIILDYLKPFMDRGLKVSFPEPERWHMIFDKREDSGNIRIPPRVILKCAQRVMS